MDTNSPVPSIASHDSGHDSVRQHIQNLRQGTNVSEAQQLIWERFYAKLVQFANQKLGQRTRRVVDGEDIAVSALHSFFVRIHDNAYPDVEDRTRLWPLLAKIATSKAINAHRHAHSLRMGAGMVRGDSVFQWVKDGGGNEHSSHPHTAPVWSGELADHVVGECQELLEELGRRDPICHVVAKLRLEDYTTQEIVQQLGYSSARTVDRIEDKIRLIWKSLDFSLATIRIESPLRPAKEFAILDEPTIVGRQRGTDPDPFAESFSLIKGGVVRRIILASHNQTRISRNQCEIMVRDQLITIKNTSDNVRLRINGEIQLLPDSTRAFRSPCRLEIDDFHMTINQAT